MFGDSDNANQNQPFVFSSTLGEFLRMVSFYFVCFGFLCSFLEYCDLNFESNAIVVNMLFDVIVIQVVLMLNSKVVFGVVGVLTFGSVIVQLVVLLFFTFTSSDIASDYPQTLIVLTCAFVMVVVVVITLLQLFCAAAMFKLSGVLPEPEQHVESGRKKSRTVSESDSGSERN